ncbi:serine hydrolase [Puia sp. P3]|uniref:serine hydrolase n=1 Tax=Puia sp. P3 TaxID=3423952 RepID=UPI003D67201F
MKQIVYVLLLAGFCPRIAAAQSSAGQPTLAQPTVTQAAAAQSPVARPRTVASPGATPEKTDPFLVDLLRSKASPFLLRVLNKPDSFRYQLIYTRIDRDKHNRPGFHNYYLRVNPQEYFNPASTVKMPLAFLAMEKINSLHRYGITRGTPMLTDSSYSGQSVAIKDTSASDSLPSVAQYVRKIFLVSDNDAYSRLYEFLGQEWINRRLWQMGYPDIRITRRFVPMNEDENRHTNQIDFVSAGKTLYTQPPAYSTVPFDFSHKVLMGNGHLDRHDSLIREPMDFTTHNNFPLEDGQRILQSVLFPGSVPKKQQFNLHADDYAFLYRYMSEYPHESEHPKYDTGEYFDSYTKFFLFKSGRGQIPSYIRVFNKPGWAYGFLTDYAYIADFKNNVEFMLSGTIYVNSDGVLNDDKYDYDEIGYPFFKEVGDIIYQYELGRKRETTPDLKKFQLQYGHDSGE